VHMCGRVCVSVYLCVKRTCAVCVCACVRANMLCAYICVCVCARACKPHNIPNAINTFLTTIALVKSS
jgi:hypothetical protein